MLAENIFIFLIISALFVIGWVAITNKVNLSFLDFLISFIIMDLTKFLI